MTSTELSVVLTLKVADSGAKPVQVVASDGRQYWVKTRNSPHGVEAILAEFIVHRVGVLIGAPVASCTLISIPDGFSQVPPYLQPGIGHASLHIENPDELLDMAHTSRDHNSQRQARLLGLWDLCLGADPQWLFDLSNDFSIHSHDHGGWFAIFEGAKWDPSFVRNSQTTPWAYTHPEPDSLDRAELVATATAIENLTDHDIADIVAAIPEEWEAPPEYVSAMATCVRSRRTTVANRLRCLASRGKEDGA